MNNNTYYPIIHTSLDTIKTDTTSIRIETIDDTIKNKENNLLIKTKLDFNKIDSILKLSKKHDTEIVLQQKKLIQTNTYKKKLVKTDTNLLVFKNLGVWKTTNLQDTTINIQNQNIFSNFNCLKVDNINKPERVLISNSLSTTSIQEKKIENRYRLPNIKFDWISIILLIAFILIGWIRFFNKRYFFSVIKSPFIYQYSTNIVKEKDSLTGRVSFVFNITYFLSLSLFIFQIFDFFKISLYHDNSLLLYSLIISSLLVLNIYRFITSKLIGFLFMKEAVFNEYFYNLNLFNKNIGLFIFPFVILYRFVEINNYKLIVISGLIILLLYMFLFVIRSFQIIIKNNVSIFYMILYLCTFEIAPFLIAVKVILPFI